jgi:hypothetical protein
MRGARASMSGARAFDVCKGLINLPFYLITNDIQYRGSLHCSAAPCSLGKRVKKEKAGTYIQPHYGNGVFGNVYLSAGQH